MQKASGSSVYDGISALRLLPREEIHAVALGRRALDTSGARGQTGTSETRIVRAAMHLRPFCITLLSGAAGQLSRNSGMSGREPHMQNELGAKGNWRGWCPASSSIERTPVEYS